MLIELIFTRAIKFPTSNMVGEQGAIMLDVNLFVSAKEEKWS